MADHYKVLGVTKSASKDQIKDAFRKLAVQFHPDKHAQSSKSARDEATLKFKQVSQAYEVLIDDRKRAAYNLSFHSRSNPNPNPNYSYDPNYYYYRGGSYNRRPPPRSSPRSSRFVLKWEALFRYMSTRSFLINVTFAGILLGGTVAINMSGDTLWKIQNPGKSFEEAMSSIEKNRGRKDQE